MSKRKNTEEQSEDKRARKESRTRYELDLGDDKFMVVSEYDGEIYFHIRKYNVEGQTKYPTKTGAALTPIRWNQFLSSIDELENSINSLNRGEKVQFDQHLGGNWIVSVNSDFPCVNVRKYWQPPEQENTVPTKKGITLKFSEFRKLVSSLDVINSHAPELADVVPCIQREDHQNQLGALMCLECNPNEYQNW